MIRKANKFDIPFIVEMLKEYRNESPIEILKQANDKDYVEKFLFSLIIGAGFIFLAEKNNKIIGMLIAGFIPNIWCPSIKQCSEFAYYVNPDYRGTTAGYRLIKAYTNECDEMLKSGRIQLNTISKMVSSPNLKYDKFGFQKLEETWVK